MSHRMAFIVNPHSGQGATGRMWPRIRARAVDRLGFFQTWMTERPGQGSDLARRALDAGAEIVVCVGGDGTLNEAVNGLMDPDGQVRPGIRLGFIPRGTGGDLARTLPFPADLEEALDALSKGKTRSLDLGRFTFQDHRGEQTVRYFHNVLSFGLGGEVDERVNRTTKVFGGFLSFIYATLVSVLVYDKKRIHLCVDDCFEEEIPMWNVAVANGRYHGGGMCVAPDARIDDGLFHITVIGDLTLAGVFKNFPKLYNGKIYGVPNVKNLTGKRITARSDQTVLLDVDGEQPGRLPAEIEIVPSAIRVVCGD